MKSHRFLVFLVFLLCGSNSLHAQNAESTAGLQQRSMHNLYPLRFSPWPKDAPFFAFYLKSCEREGEQAGANDVSYLGRTVAVIVDHVHEPVEHHAMLYGGDIASGLYQLLMSTPTGFYTRFVSILRR